MEFDRRFADQLHALRTAGSSAGLVGGWYLHSALGVGFACPAGWIARDMEEIAPVAEGKMVNSHEELLNEILQSNASEHLPLVVVAPPELDDPIARLGPHEIAPLIALHLETEPVSPLLVEHVRGDVALFHAHMEDYRLLSALQPLRISDHEAIGYIASYRQGHMDAASWCPVRERAFYIKHGLFIYELRLCDYPDVDPRLAFDFGDFARGIVLR